MTTDGLLSVTNWIYLLSLFIAAVASVGLWRLSIASGEEKDRQLEHYKTEAAERIAGANATAESARAEAAQANERSRGLEKDAEVARAEQERLKVRSLDLELQIKKIGPREILVSQFEAIKAASAEESFKPMIRLDSAGDPESQRFAQIIANALGESGFSVRGGSTIISGSSPGLAVFDPSGAIQRVLIRGGIQFGQATNYGSNQETFIVVGQKPAE
ncbi:hypothetical protein [Methylobacterium sp. Leaf117]|uniref:hypothetical protein n=1 Tax=Methylobacterium sp. Leaf117 TaxID=1736260 RepID=UPI0012E245B2|nr:hypothetical protein [Methylobacterium sp. Leaf117]